MNSRIENLSQQLGSLLLSRQLTVTCAESCTGGGIASAITDIPGSSQWFHVGFVTYSNETKQACLGVSIDALNTEGAVSELVVKQMADGALAATEADLVVAVSGIAGPDGGSYNKPVGMVWFCWALHDKKTGLIIKNVTECHQFTGGRATVRKASVERAILGLIKLLEN